MKKKVATTPKRLAEAERARQVMQLRMLGYSERAIANQLGLSPAGVHKILHRELALIRAETGDAAEEARKLELERLDALQRAIMPMAVGIDPVTGTKVAPSLQATDRVLRIMERRAALLGLDFKPKGEDDNDAPLTEFTLVIDGQVVRPPAAIPGPVVELPNWTNATNTPQ